MRAKDPKTAVLPDSMLQPRMPVAAPARAISFGPPPPPLPAAPSAGQDTTLLDAFVAEWVLPFSSNKATASSAIAVTPVNAVNACALAWRRGDVHRVTVIVKATFALTPNGPAQWIKPAPIVTRDRASAEGEVSCTLEQASEIAPYIPTAGVVLSGHAHAPNGRPTSAMTVRLALYRENALIDKQVHVFGDRDSHGSAPRPFRTMPLVHERPNLVDPRDPRRLAAFGPLARTSFRRQRLLGTVEPATLEAAVPELPRNFDCQYFNAAPFDQQATFLHGNEWIVLDGMHPTLSRVQTQLPSVVGKARWNRVAPDGPEPSEAVELVADMLVIDAEQMICSVIWRGHIIRSQQEATLPLQVFAGLELGGQPIDWPTSRSPSWSEAALAETAPIRFMASARPVVTDVTGPVDVRLFRTALPFDGTQKTAPTVPERAMATEEIDIRSLQRAITPFNEPVRPAPARVPPPELVLPWEMQSVPVPVPIPVPIPTVTAPSEPPRAMEAPPVLPLLTYPVERCAAIAASIAHRKLDKAAILQAHDLTSEVWTALDVYWKEASQQESQRGNLTLLHAYDAAYVSEIEAQRGKITVNEYARLTIAVDNGNAQDILAELDLPRSALIRVQRVWLDRVSQSSALAEQVSEAVERAAAADSTLSPPGHKAC